MKNNFGIYVHIPFCVAKCNYCSFVSKCASTQQIGEYINFLCTEIKHKSHYFNKNIVTSVYIGGGTPSHICSKHIGKILKQIKQCFNLSNHAEISIECNPCSTTSAKLKAYKSFGINRISFGVQSFNNQELNIIDRKHTSSQAIKAINLANKIGFNNISADIMIGIPNQTKQSLNKTLQTLEKLNLTHISAYMLMQEKGTKLFSQIKNKELIVASDDECVDMYNFAVTKLKKLGFKRYEISNFAKLNFACYHNQNYWQMGQYVGFGVAAHSYYNGARFANSESFEDYYKMVKTLKNCTKMQKNNKKMPNNCNFYSKSYEKLTNNQIIEETIMLGLRTSKGVSIKKLNDLGYDILNIKKDVINALIKNKIIKLKNNSICLTNKNFGLCSAVVLELI